MTPIRRFYTAPLLAAACLSSSFAAEAPHDVVIYGGTASGAAAAVQVARMGHSVVLIEPGQHIGGLTSGGLGMTDSGDKAAIGGIAREFYRRLRKHYDQPSAWKWEKPEDYKWFKDKEDAAWRFEPAVAEKILGEMLTEAKVEVVKGQRLDLNGGAGTAGGRLTAIRMEGGRTFSGKVFIDATYEGDLMARAGVSYHVGREANATYGETLNGVQVKNATKHQFTADIDPYVVAGDPKSGLLPEIHAGPPGNDGEADKRLQAYNYRLCLTDVPENRIPIEKPANYNPQRYEIGLRYALAGNQIWGKPDMMPNRKTDLNNNGAFSTDHIGANYGYPDGDYATRAAILKDHIEYQQGFLYFLANDPRVPEKLRREWAPWGLAKDEFADTGHWPFQIYVREARRMVSDWVHTEHDCRQTRETPEPVGLGSYNMDSHNAQRYVDARGFARNEGDIQVSPGGPYPISYRSIRPRESECTNLLVPVCVSSSHIAYGSIRMEPVFMVLGQSAATAACLAIDGGISVQKVPYEALRKRLFADGQVLEWKRAPKPAGNDESAPRNRDVSKLPGIVVDDTAATFEGSWEESQALPGYVGHGYRHTDKGAGKATFSAKAPATGDYEIGLTWVPSSNRCRQTRARAFLAGSSVAEITVDQTARPQLDNWLPIGRLSAQAGQPIVVELSAGAGGHTIADAVWIKPLTK